MSLQPSNFIRPKPFPDPWISFPDSRPKARMRLFCLPYGGGGTVAYFPWNKDLPLDIELCPIRLPGRESRLKEQPFSNLDPLVDVLAEVMSQYLDKPFAIFGHSMGALIGFFLLARLEGRYSPSTTRLYASGRRSPHLVNPDPPINYLADHLFIEEIQKRYNGIPHQVLKDKDLLQLLLPTLRADFKLLETYQYRGEKLACPIYAFGGSQDEQVRAEDLSAWGQLTTGDFRYRFFPGRHFYLQTQQKALLAAIVSDLEKL